MQIPERLAAVEAITAEHNRRLGDVNGSIGRNAQATESLRSDFGQHRTDVMVALTELKAAVTHVPSVWSNRAKVATACGGAFGGACGVVLALLHSF